MFRASRLVLQVYELDRGDGEALSEMAVNVLGINTIGEVKKSIWSNSHEYSLQPQVFDIRYKGRVLGDNEVLQDIAADFEINFDLVIDPLLLQELPRQVPEPDYFTVRLNQEHGEIYRVKTTLNSTVAKLKDSFIDLHYKKFNKLILGQRIQFSYKARMLDDKQTLSNVLGIDIPPKETVEIMVIISGGKVVTRFHIRINSNIRQLQGLNLFEIDKATTLETLKQRIADRINLVSPAFQTDQMVMTNSTDDSIIPTNDSIYYSMDLNDNLINDNDGIVDMNLEIEQVANENNTESSPERPRILPIEPTKIVLQDGQQWSLIGESYERMIPNDQHIPTGDEIENIHKRELLVDQSDLAPLLYDLTLDDSNRKATLNPSQCIIVDNPNYAPYLLLNPSAAAKLYNEFKLEDGESLIQQVKVIQYQEAETPGALYDNLNNEARMNDNNNAENEPNNGDQNRNLQQFIREAYNQFANRFLAIGIRILILLTIIDFSMPWKYWKFLIVYGFVLFTLYCIFIGGVRIADKIDELLPTRNEPRPIHEKLLLGIGKILRFASGTTTSVLSNIGLELIRTGVSRTYDYEIILNRRQRNWFSTLTENINFASKDMLLYVLSLSPRLTDVIESEVNDWKRGEYELLKSKLFISLDLLQALTNDYNRKHTPNLTLPNVLTEYEVTKILTHDPSNGTPDEVTFEKRYRLALEFYYLSELLCVPLNGAFVKEKPLSNDILAALHTSTQMIDTMDMPTFG